MDDATTVALVAERLLYEGVGPGLILDGFPGTSPRPRRSRRSSRRGDDNPESVARRLAAYHAETEPLAGFYRSRGILHVLDASAGRAAVLASALSALGRQAAAWTPGVTGAYTGPMGNDIATSPECRSAVEAILAAYGHDVPLAITLFGSRARGDAREDSDWDLLVLLPAGWSPPGGGFLDDPRWAVEEALDAMGGQVVPFTLDRLLSGQGWPLYRRVLREGVVLWGEPLDAREWDGEALARRGGATMLDFAASHVLMAAGFLDEGLAAGDGDGDGDGWVRETRLTLALDSARTALARSFDAWACRAEAYGPSSKGLPGGWQDVAAGNSLPSPLAESLGRACGGLLDAGFLLDRDRDADYEPVLEVVPEAVAGVLGFFRSVAGYLDGDLLPPEQERIAEAIAATEAAVGR